MAQYFYDKQIRRFVNQFIRIFSQFEVEYGKDGNGNTILHRVPARYADTNRLVSSLMTNPAENKIPSVPLITIYINQLKYDRERIQEPNFVEKRSIRERARNEDGSFSTMQKQAFTLERLMPVPYRLTLKVDIWTSSIEQKLQLLEQILTIFNPALEIQNTDNYLDWSSLSYVQLVDTEWSSRSIPVGVDDPLEVSSLTFDLPIFITTPAKLKRLGVIQQIVDSVYDSNGNLSDSILYESELTARRQYFTPLGYNIIVLNGQVQLIKRFGPVDQGNNINLPHTIGTPINWQPLLSSLGEITNGMTQMYLIDEVTDKLVVGTIALHPSDPTIMLFTPDRDTIPSNTLQPVSTIIDPYKLAPGAGLPVAAMGQRYLILKDIGDSRNNSNNQPTAWRNADNSMLFAHANDIIEYDGSRWNISFDSQQTQTVEYVTNLYSGVQYKWFNNEWKKSWEGYYNEGFWALVI